jgi:hypothetical protein
VAVAERPESRAIARENGFRARTPTVVAARKSPAHSGASHLGEPTPTAGKASHYNKAIRSRLAAVTATGHFGWSGADLPMHRA